MKISKEAELVIEQIKQDPLMGEEMKEFAIKSILEMEEKLRLLDVP